MVWCLIKKMNYMQNLVVTQNCNCTIVIFAEQQQQQERKKKRKSTGLNYWRGESAREK